jgi:hypothetical protein
VDEPAVMLMPRCAYCDKGGLVWRKLEGRWRLFARASGAKADLLRPHLCLSDAAIDNKTRAYKD